MYDDDLGGTSRSRKSDVVLRCFLIPMQRCTVVYYLEVVDPVLPIDYYILA